MDNPAIFLEILTMLITAAFAVGFLIGFVHFAIEPFYLILFKKPLYVHLYFRPKKIPSSQKRILESSVPFYRKLTPRKKVFFEHRVAEFLENYQFHGKSGQEITDEIKIMVSSTYLMLTFGMRNYKIDVFDKIIIYPDSYHSVINDVLHNGEFNPQYRAVVFSWTHFRQGYEEGSDNINLGIHEFGHALHFHGMMKRDNSSAVFAHMYSQIMKEVKHPPNAKRLISSEYFRIYGYTNQFEFLAVILEHFFETPDKFRREFPELYKSVSIMINYDVKYFT